VPAHVEDAEPAPNGVPTEDLERDDERVLHEVRVDGAVEDVDRAVVRARCKQRVGRVVVDRADGTGLVPLSRGQCEGASVQRVGALVEVRQLTDLSVLYGLVLRSRSNQQSFLSYEPTMRLSPSGWMSTDDSHLRPGWSVLMSV
jgi:hypothetical protein